MEPLPSKMRIKLVKIIRKQSFKFCGNYPKKIQQVKKYSIKSGQEQQESGELEP